VVYCTGENGPWPTDWTEPDGNGLRLGPQLEGDPYNQERTYYPFRPNRAGGHLYFVPAPGLGVDGQGYLLNSKTGFEHPLFPVSYSAADGGVSHVYTWEKIEPQPGDDNFHDGRIRPKWKLNCQIFWRRPNMPIDYTCGRTYPQWPPRPKLSRLR
jgi:hypothetical protein